MASETTIPMLPCVSLDETMDFYRVLGFEVAYQQTRPNPYAVVRRGGIELHFFGVKGLEPEHAYSSCMVLVPEVEQLHEVFAGALRKAYGKLPVTGFPRLARMKKGQSRFHVVDPAGNWLRFIKQDAEDVDHEAAAEADQGTRSKLAQALDTVTLLRDFKGDDTAAAKVLDAALRRKEPAPAIDRARALAARAELAVALGDQERADALLSELERLPLSDEDRAQFQEELQAADALRRSLQ
jgi:catechol 2,3-dioxygenase-like lactoylglutathione lyase family enzyme